MTSFDVLAGDFGDKKKGVVSRTHLTISGTAFKKPTCLSVETIESLDIVTQETAGMFARRRTVLFTIRLEDGRRLLGSARFKAFAQIQAALFSLLNKKGESIEEQEAKKPSVEIAVFPAGSAEPAATEGKTDPVRKPFRTITHVRPATKSGEEKAVAIFSVSLALIGLAAIPFVPRFHIQKATVEQSISTQRDQTEVVVKAPSKFPKGSWEEAYESFNADLVASNAERSATPYFVSADPNAHYVLIGYKVVPSGLVLATSRRIGSSGTSYSTRLINCDGMAFKYVGEGDTLSHIDFSPDPSMSPLVYGSSSDQAVRFVCSRIKEQS